MKTISSQFVSGQNQLLYIVVLPVFFLAFVTLYKPTGIVAFLDMGKQMLSFNVTILGCIMLGVLLLSRTLLIVLHKPMHIGYWGWIGWQAVELLVMSLFMALYMALMYQGAYTYYQVVGHCLYAALVVEVYPITVLGLSLGIAAAKAEGTAQPNDSLMRFRDSQKQVKLIIASSAVLYIEAKENYVLIKYLEGDVVKEYSLRSSMLALEEMLGKNGIVRCQRSYYVNPEHVTALRKDKEGIISAELNVQGLKSIPVSPKYYAMVAAKL